MSFKLIVVGHPDTNSTIDKIAKKHFDDIQIFRQDFSPDSHLDTIADTIQHIQKEYDGILYSRKDPYLLVSNLIRHTIPARYVNIDQSHFLIALLKGFVQNGGDIGNISYDSMSRSEVIESYACIGLSEAKLTLCPVSFDMYQRNMVEVALEGHLNNFYSGSQLCITNIMAVHTRLKAMDIPSVIIVPSEESFVHEIRNLRLRHKLKSATSGTLAYMSVTLQWKDEYRFYHEIPVKLIEEVAKASKILLHFAEHVDGCLITLAQKEFDIICNRDLLMDAFGQFTDIYLATELVDQTMFDCFIGIGCGDTIAQAHMHSSSALYQANTFATANTYVIFPDASHAGPFIVKNPGVVTSVSRDTENLLQTIAIESSVHMAMLEKIYQCIHTRNSNTFTTMELADMLDVSPRTVNRTITKLLDSGYASVVGHANLLEKGRPSRLIRFLF